MACLLLGATTRPAQASDGTRCPIVDGATPSLATVNAEDRLAFVRETMRDQARRAKQWSYAWAAVGIGLSAGGYTRAALAKTNDERLDPAVSGTTSLVIPLSILLQPLQVMGHQATLDRHLSTATDSSTDMCESLALGERLLAASAENEAHKAGIFTHLFVIGGNGAVALFLGLGYGHWEGALVNGGGGLLISELQIFTQPTGAVSALARYRRGEVAASASPATGVRWHWLPLVGQNVTGIAVAGSF